MSLSLEERSVIASKVKLDGMDAAVTYCTPKMVQKEAPKKAVCYLPSLDRLNEITKATTRE